MKDAKPQSWTIAAIDARSRWDEYEEAAEAARVRWMWIVSALKDTDDGHAARVEDARVKLGLNLVNVSGWGNA